MQCKGRSSALPMASPSPEQDLGDLAEVVLAKLEQAGIKDAPPVVLQFHAKLRHGRQCDQGAMKVERVWLNGAVHWRLHGNDQYRPKGKGVQVVLRDPRTVARFVLGRARELHGTGADIDWEVDMHVSVRAADVSSVLWSTRMPAARLMNGRGALDVELEVVRLLQELAAVRVVPA